jgi:hypothetical protein
MRRRRVQYVDRVDQEFLGVVNDGTNVGKNFRFQISDLKLIREPKKTAMP